MWSHLLVFPLGHHEPLDIEAVQFHLRCNFPHHFWHLENTVFRAHWSHFSYALHLLQAVQNTGHLQGLLGTSWETRDLINLAQPICHILISSEENSTAEIIQPRAAISFPAYAFEHIAPHFLSLNVVFFLVFSFYWCILFLYLHHPFGVFLLTGVETVKARSWRMRRCSGFQHWDGELKLFVSAYSKGHRGVPLEKWS